MAQVMMADRLPRLQVHDTLPRLQVTLPRLLHHLWLVFVCFEGVAGAV
jgi:hypothetical protein